MIVIVLFLFYTVGEGVTAKRLMENVAGTSNGKPKENFLNAMLLIVPGNDNDFHVGLFITGDTFIIKDSVLKNVHLGETSVNGHVLPAIEGVLRPKFMSQPLMANIDTFSRVAYGPLLTAIEQIGKVSCAEVDIHLIDGTSPYC